MKSPDPRIWAGGIVGRVGQRENILVFANGEAFHLAELRVFEFLGKQF